VSDRPKRYVIVEIAVAVPDEVVTQGNRWDYFAMWDYLNREMAKSGIEALPPHLLDTQGQRTQ
jgi:hypothetical protein